MYKMMITAKTVTELNDKILSLASEIKKTPGDPETGSTGPIDTFPKTIQGDIAMHANIKPVADLSADTLADSPANRRPFTAQAEAPAAPKKRGPKGKKGNAFLGTTETVVASVAQVPPMPTTQFNTNMPSLTPVDVTAPPVQTAPQTFAPPLQSQPVNGYTFESFKANFVHVITVLADEGKIDQAWLDSTGAAFEGRSIEQWPKYEETLKGLFNAMVDWKLVERIG